MEFIPSISSDHLDHVLCPGRFPQPWTPAAGCMQTKVVADATASFSVPAFTVPAGKTVNFEFTIVAPASLRGASLESLHCHAGRASGWTSHELLHWMGASLLWRLGKARQGTARRSVRNQVCGSILPSGQLTHAHAALCVSALTVHFCDEPHVLRHSRSGWLCFVLPLVCSPCEVSQTPPARTAVYSTRTDTAAPPRSSIPLWRLGRAHL